MALNEFEGTVMLVSHDRALLRAVCDEFWLVGRGEIKPFDGDLDDYQQYLLNESKRLREEAKLASEETVAPTTIQTTVSEVKKSPIQTSEQRKLESARRQEINAQIKPIKKQIEKLEKVMAELQLEKSQLEARLMEPIQAQEIAQIGKKLKSLGDELNSVEEQWMDCVAQIETIESNH
jgi:ATP-binding cassette subfamily F protein 3